MPLRATRPSAPCNACTTSINPFFIKQSAALAERLAGDAGNGTEARVKRAYELLFSRPPDDTELAAASQYLESETWDRYCQVLLASSEFLTVR